MLHHNESALNLLLIKENPDIIVERFVKPVMDSINILCDNKSIFYKKKSVV